MLKYTFSASAILLALLLPVLAHPDKPDYNQDVTVTKLLRTSTNSIGQPIAYPHDAPAEASVLLIDIPPGKQTGWHKHPVPLFGYVMAGTITVHFADGKKNVFHQGEAFAESVDTLHNGINEGPDPVKLLVFVAGEKEMPFTIKAAVDKDGRPLGDYETLKGNQ